MKDNLIPERLKNAREALSITKLEASKRMSIGQATYVRYENGDRKPTYVTIVRMAQVLNVNPDYLVGKTDKPKTDMFLISKNDSPEMYKLVDEVNNIEPKMIEHLIEYAKIIKKK